MGHGVQHNDVVLSNSIGANSVADLVHRAAHAIVARVQPTPPASRVTQVDVSAPSPAVPKSPAPQLNLDAAPAPSIAAPVVQPITQTPEPVVSDWTVSALRARAAAFWNQHLQDRAYRLGRIASYAFAVWFGCVTFLIVLYRFVDPPASNLMLYHHLVGTNVRHTWVPLEKISPAVIKAVVVAEDAQFCRHWGIDFVAIEQAIENARGRTPRGASTITMQTAKNMFLWQSKSYVRKILEVPVTIMIELVWPKKRILEVYLNIAEWGPGIFGIGAAAKHHFKTIPAHLGTTAAARLAASLPNPKVRRAGHPGPRTRRKANVIQGRARYAGYYTGCVLR